MSAPNPASAAVGPLILLLAGFMVAACGSTRPQTVFEDPATLHAERDEWRGSREGTVVLRYHVEGLVDSRPDPSRAESSLVIHLVAARFSGPLAPLEFALPPGAVLARAATRVLAPGLPDTLGEIAPETRRRSDLDPFVELATPALPEPPEGALVEAILEYAVPGTLTSDVRWLGFENAALGEALLRYSLPTHGRGTFTTSLPNARPITTEKDGRTLIALFAQDIAPLPADASTRPLARFVTATTAPLGYSQDHASGWNAVAAPYVAGLSARSEALTDGYAVPHAATDAADALAWVQARTERPDAFVVPWNEPALLPDAIATNKLSAVDKTHLLAWLLREAKVPFLYAIGRPNGLPTLAPDFPVPNAFSTPLLFLPTLGRFADPACRECSLGQVRKTLAGAQALVLAPPGQGLGAQLMTMDTP